ncbi:hypothetical protein B0H14DRAFT_3774565 [Mycena olivaceomarginata]|nr:hypothetical protein B0H14DRAFT_3774565 [Mycena olivaceomarginata]
MTAPDVADKNVLLRLRRLPVPEAKIVRKLIKSSRQAYLEGYRSLMYSHISSNVTTHFPLSLWVHTYWNALVDFKRDARGPWVRAQMWVRKQKTLAKRNRETAAVIEEMTLLLSMLPWGWKKMGLSDSEPYHKLSRLLGPNWLARLQQNDMLELLRQKIDSDSESAPRLRVQGVELVPKIIQAFKTARTDTYQTDRSFRWIRDLAEDLVQNTAARITTGHLGVITEEPHWISLVIDLSKPGAAAIRYGDSFGRHIPAEILQLTHVIDESASTSPCI